MKTKSVSVFVLSIFLAIMTFGPATAQENTLKLGLSRTMGYGGMNNDIQGLFTMKAQGPDSIVRVEFFIDEIMIGEDSEAPFSIQFTTDSYPPGNHNIKAIGYTSSGDELQSNVIRVEFVAEDEVWQRMIGVVGPILAIVVIAVVASAVVPLLMNRGKSIPLGQPRRYLLGGTLCPKCGRPFELSLFKLNLGVGSLDRCPHCGKWSLVRRVPLNLLREAEAAELEQAESRGQIEELSEGEKLKRDLDASRYQDS